MLKKDTTGLKILSEDKATQGLQDHTQGKSWSKSAIWSFKLQLEELKRKSWSIILMGIDIHTLQFQH